MRSRRISQVASLILLHSSWGPEFKWLCNPVLSCHSCVLAWFACPVGIFVHYSGYHVFPFLAVGTVLLIGALIGRLLCGWVCPFGFVMDLLYKIPSPKFDLPAWTRFIKYVILVATVFLLPFLFGESTYYSFCRVCPASALQVTIPGFFLGGTLSTGMIVKLAILVGVLVLAVFSSRSFCKVFCPIGAMLGPLNYVSFWAMNLPSRRPCTGCRRCDRVCPVNGYPMSRISNQIPPNRVAECVVCHDCQNTCPQKRIEEGPGRPQPEPLRSDAGR